MNLSEREIYFLRETLKQVVDQWSPHCGSCCFTDVNGDLKVTDWSCQCHDLQRDVRSCYKIMNPDWKPEHGY